MIPEGTGPRADPRKYARLAAALRGPILDGTLRPGESMPSITVLAAEHGWARQTCAKALHVLEAEGLVLRVKGIGYFANGPIGMPAGCAHQPATPRGDDLLQSRDDE